MLNGFSGRQSETAFEQVKQDIEDMGGRPKRLIWCLGMNDGDGANVISREWRLATDALMELCRKYNIELILATIPNVPTVINTNKNKYIRYSGYRYIDFASAVGASDDNEWYSNMREDAVHPSAEGAKALYSQAILNVPELISYT